MADSAARRTSLAVGTAAVVAVAVALVVEFGGPMGPGMGGRPAGGAFDALVRVRIAVTTFNVVVLALLTRNYVSLYREIPSQFTGSLVLFCVALTLYALSSNPLVHLLLGFRGGPGLGPFVFLPDVFASVAVVALLYQSYQ